MAPVKKDDKEAKLTPEQSATLILDYLRKQNRPYSATDISTNLKNRVTKAAAAKLLKDMHERKELEGRAAGKQIVYHAIQDEDDSCTVEVLSEMDAQTTRLKDATIGLRGEEKSLRAELREGSSKVPLTELKASIASLENAKVEMTARLGKLKSGSVKPVSAEEREQVTKAHVSWEKTSNARLKIRDEVWKMIAGELGAEKAGEEKEKLGLEF